MIIFGVDPGTRVTGYGIVFVKGANVLELVDFGCIRPPVQSREEEKYLIIFEGIESLIKRHGAEAISVETQFVHKNVQSALKLAMARGAVMIAAARQGVHLFEYAPSKVKLAVVGKGNGSKSQVQRMVQMQLRLPSLPVPEDAADALALALCHAYNGGRKRYVGVCSRESC